MKTALIIGITGQDGAYLTRLLLEKDYRVYGTYRRTSTPNFWRLQELGMLDHPQLTLLEYDLTDVGSSVRLVEKTEPEEIYNLGAQSFVHVSFDQPQTTAAITGLGPLNVLEAIRVVNPKIRFFQASSAEMFGLVQAIPQDETTPFYPRSPYAVAKLYAHWITVNYREAFDIFGCSAILFNHESPLRGREFVTRKITEAVARIKLGRQDMLELGNLSAKRDWGYAPEYVEGMWRMMQAETPDTFVLATNRTETVRNFATLCFAAAGMPIEWEGAGQDEVGRLGNGRVCVRVDPRYHRPSEVELLIGNPAKAREKLGWQTKTRLEDVTLMMLDADLRRSGTHAEPSPGR